MKATEMKPRSEDAHSDLRPLYSFIEKRGKLAAKSERRIVLAASADEA